MKTIVHWTDGFGNNHMGPPIGRFIHDGIEYCVVQPNPSRAFEIIKIFERKLAFAELLYGEMV